LFGFQIFFQAPGAKLAPKTGLFIAAPWRFDIGGLHVIYPHDAGAQRLYYAERFVDVARPDSRSQAVGSIVGDSDCIRFSIERNYRGNRTEDFFACDAGSVVDVVENRGLQVIALSELLRPAAADGDFCFSSR